MNKKKLKYIALALLAVILIAFLIQNSALVEVKLLFWPIHIPRSLLILISVGIGALGNFIFMMLKKDKQQVTAPKVEKVKKGDSDNEVAEW